MNQNSKQKQTTNRKKGLVDPKNIKEFTVYVDTTLMEFLMFKMPDTPRKTIKSLLTNHQVSVGGVPVSQYNFPLAKEDVVIVSKYRIAKHNRTDLPIIYEDEDIIAMDKPSGLLSIASDREKGKTAYRLISDYVMSKNKKDRIYVVHRLDEDTSGVLIFAKNLRTKEALQNNWGDIVKKRKYYAIVEGKMEKEEGRVVNYLTENSLNLVYVTKDKKHGKQCITEYKTIKFTNPYSLLDVEIFTGRKNQIRVTLGDMGHFVIGDDKYGEPANPIKRLGLHAYELDFTNPLNGKHYNLTSPMPKSFKDLIFKGKAEKSEKKENKDFRFSHSATKISTASNNSSRKRRKKK